MPSQATILLVVLLLFTTTGAQTETFKACESELRAWAEENGSQQNSNVTLEDNGASSGLVFFLHIPRTGGRTFHQCFLKSIIPPEQHCPRSYDIRRVDLRDRGCRLLVSHDDYSILQQLRGKHVRVVTNMRDPVDRIRSAYEFANEIVVRAHPRQGAGALRRGGALVRGALGAQRHASAAPGHRNRLSTMNVWPWSRLVPMMQRDLRRRNLFAAGNVTEDRGRSPRAGMRTVTRIRNLMPFDEFVKHPLVADLLHNGATFQIAGLTDTSLLPNAGRLRSCVIDHPALGHHVLAVAKQRLLNMYSVGLTDTPPQHHVSASLLANQLLPLNPLPSRFSSEGNSALIGDGRGKVEDGRASTSKERRERVMYRYERCVKVQRQRYSARRDAAIQLLASSTLSRDMRRNIPENTTDAIRAMNHLDSDLHTFAQQIFRNKQMLVSGRREEGRVETETLNKAKQHVEPSAQQCERSFLGGCYRRSPYLRLLERIYPFLHQGPLCIHDYIVKLFVWLDMREQTIALAATLTSLGMAAFVVRLGLGNTTFVSPFVTHGASRDSE